MGNRGGINEKRKRIEFGEGGKEYMIFV